MKKIAKFLEEAQIIDLINHHLQNNIPLTENDFKPDTKYASMFYNTARKMYECGILKTASDTDITVLAKLETGKEAIYQGRKVKLDSPTRISGGDKKYRVYTNSGKKDKDGNIVAKKIEWGAPGVQIKNDNDKARKSFLKRHQCDLKNDKTKPGWWACNIHLFSKQLGLKSSKPW